MSYQVLARKWRPHKFSELVGQEHVVSAITNALENNKLHHAYLFTGTRGVGKTTIARIFSKSLNCEQGLGANPCGECNACVDIDNGSFVDLLEIDAASRTKVEDTRDLLDNVQYAPTRGKYKVYLIDEVHMLSKHSFNALLKTLEEPPPHVKFLLATTDPQKLPVTILSRCLQFSLKALSREQIQTQLEYVLGQEHIPSEKLAITHIARAAQGSMRDALSLTDQAIAQGNNRIDTSIVVSMLGLLDKNHTLKLLSAVIKKEGNEVIQQLDELALHAPNYADILSELLSLLHQVALTQIVPDVCKLETVYAKAIYQLAKSVPAEQIQLLYEIALQGKKSLSYAPEPATGVQMILLRMLSFMPVITVDFDIAGFVIPTPDLTFNDVESKETLDVKKNNELTSLEENQNILSSQSSTVKAVVSEPLLLIENTSEPAQPAVIETGSADNEFIQRDSADEEYMAMSDLVEDDIQHGFLGDLSSTDEHTDRHFDKLNVNQHMSHEETKPVSDLQTTQSLIAIAAQLQQSEQQVTQDVAQEVDALALAEQSIQLSIKNRNEHEALKVVDKSAIENASHKVPEDYPPWETPVNKVVDDQAYSLDNKTDTDEPKIAQVDSSSNNPNLALIDSNQTEQNQQSITDTERVSQHAQQEIDEHHAVDNNRSEVSAYLENGEKLLNASQIDAWSHFIEALPVAGLTKQLLLQSNLISDGINFSIRISPKSVHLDEQQHTSTIIDALSEHYGQAVQFMVTVGDVKDTPFQLQTRIDNMRRRHAHKTVETDHTIQELMKAFDAKVIEGTIQPK